MAGLNCGRPSIIAWPIVSQGIDAFIAIPDERAREAMRAWPVRGNRRRRNRRGGVWPA